MKKTFGASDELLTAAEILTRLRSFKNWKRKGDAIRKTYTFTGFVQAMGFVNSVALLAQRANHHPAIDIRWNKVTLVCSTHSAGGLTEKDFALARKFDALSLR
jgi:4a-hydroxytetrahydrobiopterin dehydratase